MKNQTKNATIHLKMMKHKWKKQYLKYYLDQKIAQKEIFSSIQFSTNHENPKNQHFSPPKDYK
jgi:hypothetical protein